MTPAARAGIEGEGGRDVVVGGPHFYALRGDSDIGGEVYERELLGRLPAHGVELVLGLPRDHAVFVPPAGWAIDVLGHDRRLHWTRAPLTFTPYAYRLLRAGRVDLLRGHSVRYTGPALLAARALVCARTRVRVPVVLHHHHLYPRWARLEAAIAARADAVITVSEHARSALIARGVPASRLHAVHQGISRPPPTGGWTGAWPADGLRLLGLGRLERRKRPELAIDALAGLQRAGIPASLVLAGQGELEAELVRRAAAQGVAERVRFAGRVTEGDKWRLYDSAQALVFGSTLEGFGLVVAEAQSRGVPVVAASGTATAEALDPGRSGLLVAPEPAAFTAALRQLVQAGPQAREAMSARAREFAARFDWDACAAGVAGIYRELAAPR